MKPNKLQNTLSDQVNPTLFFLLHLILSSWFFSLATQTKYIGLPGHSYKRRSKRETFCFDTFFSSFDFVSLMLIWHLFESHLILCSCIHTVCFILPLSLLFCKIHQLPVTLNKQHSYGLFNIFKSTLCQKLIFQNCCSFISLNCFISNPC